MAGGHSILKDTIFTGATGRELRRHPAEVRELQFWLTCGPDRDPFGIYIAEPDSIAPRIGRTVGNVRKSLETLVALNYCLWDEASQFVWVVEMAHHQFGTPLKAVDFRCTTARKWYAAAPRNPFLGLWFDRYAEDFHLDKDPHAVERRDYAPSQGASPGASDAPLSDLSSSALFDLQPEDKKTGQIVTAPDAPLTGHALEGAFTQLWTEYPNAVERKAARSAFAKAKPTAALVATMLAAVRAAKLGRAWKQGYIPKLANWIEKQRWLDRIEVDQAAPAMTQKTSNTMGAAQRFVERRQGPPRDPARHPS